MKYKMPKVLSLPPTKNCKLMMVNPLFGLVEQMTLSTDSNLIGLEISCFSLRHKVPISLIEISIVGIED